MRKRTFDIVIGEGTEVHGPNGWVTLLGDVRITDAVKDESGERFVYPIRNDEFSVSVAEALVLS